MGDSITQFLHDISSRTELRMLFDELFNPDSKLPVLFFLHKNDFFLSIEDANVNLPVLFWVNKIEPRIESISFFKKKHEVETEKTWQDIKVAFSEFQQMLSPFFEYFKEHPEIILKEDIQLPPEIEKELLQRTAKIQKRFQSLIGEIKKNPVKYLRMFTKFMIDPNIYLQTEAQKEVQRLGDLLEIKLEEYQALLSGLYRMGLIRVLQTILWCSSCIKPVIFTSESDLEPKEHGVECPKCTHQMSISSLYEIDKALWDMISFRDGLILVSIAWFLKSHYIEFEPFVKTTNYEIDFICSTDKGQVLIECKAHRFPSTERSVKGSLTQDLKQLAKHIQEYQNEKGSLLRSYLIYNYDLSPYSELVEKHQEQHKDITIIGCLDLEEELSSLIKQKE